MNQLLLLLQVEAFIVWASASNDVLRKIADIMEIVNTLTHEAIEDGLYDEACILADSIVCAYDEATIKDIEIEAAKKRLEEAERHSREHRKLHYNVEQAKYWHSRGRRNCWKQHRDNQYR